MVNIPKRKISTLKKFFLFVFGIILSSITIVITLTFDIEKIPFNITFFGYNISLFGYAFIIVILGIISTGLIKIGVTGKLAF